MPPSNKSLSIQVVRAPANGRDHQGHERGGSATPVTASSPIDRKVTANQPGRPGWPRTRPSACRPGEPAVGHQHQRAASPRRTPPTPASHPLPPDTRRSLRAGRRANCTRTGLCLTQPALQQSVARVGNGVRLGPRRRGGDRPERGGAAPAVPGVARPGRAPDRVRRFRVDRRQRRTLARSLGAEVVDLDLSRAVHRRPGPQRRVRAAARPSPPSRVRAVRRRRLRGGPGLAPDGDGRARCRARSVAVVCGRRRERLPEASVYNRLCDLEWDGPPGETEALRRRCR